MRKVSYYFLTIIILVSVLFCLRQYLKKEVGTIKKNVEEDQSRKKEVRQEFPRDDFKKDNVIENKDGLTDKQRGGLPSEEENLSEFSVLIGELKAMHPKDDIIVYADKLESALKHPELMRFVNDLSYEAMTSFYVDQTMYKEGERTETETFDQKKSRPTIQEGHFTEGIDYNRHSPELNAYLKVQRILIQSAPWPDRSVEGTAKAIAFQKEPYVQQTLLKQMLIIQPASIGQMAIYLRMNHLNMDQLLSSSIDH